MILESATRRARPHGGAIRFTALVGVGVLTAHDVIYAGQAALGSSDLAFADAAHRYWTTFVVLALLAGGLALAATLTGILRLGRALRHLPPAHEPRRLPVASFTGELVRLWPRLLGTVGLAFLVQENVEHAAAGRSLPGLWVLSGPEYPLAIPVLVLVTGLLAAVGAWFRHRRDVLVGRLRAARAALALRTRAGHAPAVRWRLVGALVALSRILARTNAGRAPPRGAAA